MSLCNSDLIECRTEINKEVNFNNLETFVEGLRIRGLVAIIDDNAVQGATVNT